MSNQQDKTDTKESSKEQQDGCNDGCIGCGCLIIVGIILFNVVSWAWGIHWGFGVLMLLFLLRFI